MRSRDPKALGGAGVLVLALSLALVMSIMCVTPAAFAGNNPAAKVAIHVRAHSAKAGCTLTPAITGCEDIVTTLTGSSVDAFPVFFNLTEYKGCSYSLSWDASWGSADFTSCSDLVIGDIVYGGPDEYAAHTWTTCQTGVCVPGFIWLYPSSAGRICAIDPSSPDLGLDVLDCAQGLDGMAQNFCAGMNGAAGDDPCAEAAPECQVEPTSIDFGTVFVGDFKDSSFTITNIGGGTLTGDPSEACPDFDIVSGGDPYSLGAGEFVVVTVRFAPGTEGLKECAVGAGTDCGDVACSGTGENPPECQVEPTSIDFGTVFVGDFKDSSFTITNIGGGTLTGDPDAICADFDIVSGGDPYSLGAGEFVVVTVRFAPGTEGLKECAVGAGTDCGDVACSGTGENPPECQVEPTSIDFGTVTAGQDSDLVFTIENIGGGLLTGDLSEACPYYEIVTGGGSYSLDAGQTREVTVRFSPILAGTFDCLIQTGTDCANVSCVGNAEAIPVYVDARPGECPNDLRVGMPLAIPVAVLGTAGFSVSDIDPTTVRLSREGVAGEVSPLNWVFNDVGTPFMGSPCDCHKLGMDGFQDLRFRFGITDLVTTLSLAPLAGTQVPLTITGNLVTGEEIEGTDCVLVISGRFWEDEYIGDVGIVTHTGFTAGRLDIRLSYYTKEYDHIVLELYDVQGRTIAVLVDDDKAPGLYDVQWDGMTQGGNRVPAGVYFARISNGSTSSTEKVTILR
jgi:hypothetical protein